MGFTFNWLDDEKTVMHYRAQGQWNWKDYHAMVRVSTFKMMNHPHAVDSWIDFRESTRPTFPAGLGAHARTFCKQNAPAMSGRAVVLGVPDDVLSNLHLGADMTLTTNDGIVVFVTTEDDARAVLKGWR